MQSIQLKAGLFTALFLIAMAVVIIVFTGLMAAIVYGLANLEGVRFNTSLTEVILAVLVSPFVFFIGWAVFELVKSLYTEMLYLLDTKRRMR